MATLVFSILDSIFLILAGNEDSHEISDEFVIHPDLTWTEELAAL